MKIKVTQNDKAIFTPPFIQRLIIDRFELVLGLILMIAAVVAFVGLWIAVGL